MRLGEPGDTRLGEPGMRLGEPGNEDTHEVKLPNPFLKFHTTFLATSSAFSLELSLFMTTDAEALCVRVRGFLFTARPLCTSAM